MRAASPLHWIKKSGAHIVLVAMCALALIHSGAVATDNWQEAGIIVDYGDDRITWIWIPFDQPEITLIDLLEQTDLEIVTIGFGGLGQGVCQIADTGCPAADCRQRMCQTSSSSPFWRLMKLNGDEWMMTSSGVSGSRVSDGDIYALSWSAETPDLPVVSIDELAMKANADRDSAEPEFAMFTEGETAKLDSSPGSWAPAAGAVSVVVVAAGVLVLRARSSPGMQS